MTHALGPSWHRHSAPPNDFQSAANRKRRKASVASWTPTAGAVDAATEAVRRVLVACDAAWQQRGRSQGQLQETTKLESRAATKLGCLLGRKHFGHMLVCCMQSKGFGLATAHAPARLRTCVAKLKDCAGFDLL